MGVFQLTANRWESLLNEIEIINGPIKWVPSTEQLDEYEAETGFRLPASYREFVQLFGAGTLACDFLVCSPASGEGRRVDLHTSNQFVHACMEDELEEYCDDPELFRRLHFFSQSGEHEEDFGWDPTDITVDGEYAVYVIYSHSMKIERIANSFEEFVREVCLGPGYFSYFKIDTWVNAVPQNSFEPERD
ncbi:MAG: SMI1/KNR4 family protein [Planctomycetaceae bacterium]|nr:SMI1/KNR4 family protein [Planctomycetaceae bacterium]